MSSLATQSRWEWPGGLSLATGVGAIERDRPNNPRGLLSVGAPIGPGGQQMLINYIAAEPTVAGARGYSELESGPDGLPGLRWSVRHVDMTKLGMVLYFELDRFANGAGVVVRAEIAADRPHELHFSTETLPRSAPLEGCDLSATMGNYAKLRRLQLGGREVRVGDLDPQFGANGFTQDIMFALPASGIVRAVPDDHVPVSEQPDDGWRYRGSIAVAQYWRTAGPPPFGASVRVNARKTYWASNKPIPGGAAFENFEVRTRPTAPAVFGVEFLGPPHAPRGGAPRRVV